MRQSKKIITIILAIIFVLGITSCGNKKEYSLGTGNSGGVYFEYGTDLANDLNDGNINVKVESTAGSAANLRLLGKGFLDMAIVQSDILLDSFNNEEYKDIRAIAGLYTEECQIIVRADSDINSIEDLYGKKVSVGEKESGVMQNARQIIEASGMKYDKIKAVNLSFSDSAKALKDGDIDAFFCTAGTPTLSVSELSDDVSIKVISIDDKTLRQLIKEYPYYTKSVIPAGTYKGQNEDVTTVSVKAVLVVNNNVSEGFVSNVTQTLFANHEELNATFATDAIPIPFHVGTVAIYEKESIDVSTNSHDEVIKEDESATRIFALDMYQTLAVAVGVLYLGAFLKKRVKFLETFCIPAPVIGGLIFAILSCVLYVTGVVEFAFDETLKTVCMVMFFTSVGFQANLKVLKSGGVSLVIFLGSVVALIIGQNFLSVGLAKLMNLNPFVGLCTGSIPMVGGHGTSGAFGPVLEDLGISGATTLCTAAATFGLIAGSLLGGPLGRKLILKHNLLKTVTQEDDTPLVEEEVKKHRSVSMYAPAAYQIAIAMGIGTIVSWLLSMTGMTFPIYIGAMIVAAIMRNVGEFSGKYKIHIGEINDIGGICLSLFLGIAMITLKLWQLAQLALPLVVLLLGQVLFMFLFSYFIVYNIMGRNYDAAILSAGTCGFGMGATPNAMANMQVLTEKYAPSVKAYILVPIVGSMFADFINSLSITFFINLL